MAEKRVKFQLFFEFNSVLLLNRRLNIGDIILMRLSKPNETSRHVPAPYKLDCFLKMV